MTTARAKARPASRRQPQPQPKLQYPDIFEQAVDAMRVGGRPALTAPVPERPLPPAEVYPRVLGRDAHVAAWLMRGPAYEPGEFEPLDTWLEQQGVPR